MRETTSLNEVNKVIVSPTIRTIKNKQLFQMANRGWCRQLMKGGKIEMCGRVALSRLLRVGCCKGVIFRVQWRHRLRRGSCCLLTVPTPRLIARLVQVSWLTKGFWYPHWRTNNRLPRDQKITSASVKCDPVIHSDHFSFYCALTLWITHQIILNSTED